MKIEAQNLRVGMNVRVGWMNVKITKLENTTFKNGKPAINVFGTLHAYTVGKGRYKRTIPAGDKMSKIFHATTMVAMA